MCSEMSQRETGGLTRIRWPTAGLYVIIVYNYFWNCCFSNDYSFCLCCYFSCRNSCCDIGRIQVAPMLVAALRLADVGVNIVNMNV